MIGGIDLTSVILGLITLLGGCGWVIDRKKHRQEIEALKVDIRQKNLDLSTEFVEKFKELIGKPLEKEVVNLRTEVNRLKDAIETVNDCPLSSDCPVRKRLRNEPNGSEGGGV